MVGGDKEIYEKVIPLFEVFITTSIESSAWVPTLSTWEVLVLVSILKCVIRFLLLLIWYTSIHSLH